MAFKENAYQQLSITDSFTGLTANDADSLISLCGNSYEDATEFELFIRCLYEQTIVEDDKCRLRTKEDGTMNFTALQNPSDSEATFRPQHY